MFQGHNGLGYMLQGHNGVIGVDVHMTTGERCAAVRAAATVDSEGARYWYLTNVAGDVLSVPDVAETYRLRGKIELFIRAHAEMAPLRAWQSRAPSPAELHAKNARRRTSSGRWQKSNLSMLATADRP